MAGNGRRGRGDEGGFRLYDVGLSDRSPCAFCLQHVDLAAARPCPRCRALYHPDCWEANDARCAVFGCEAPAAAPPQTPPPPAVTRPVPAGSRGTSTRWTAAITALVCVGISQLLRVSSPSPPPRVPAPPPPYSFQAPESLGRGGDLIKARAVVEKTRQILLNLEARGRITSAPAARETLLREVDSAIAELSRARDLFLRHEPIEDLRSDRPHFREIAVMMDRLRALRADLAGP